MTRNNFSNSNPEWFRAIEGIVLETVLYFRNRGHKRDVAIEQASLALGLSGRKTRSIFYQEPIGLGRDEYDTIRKAFARHLAHQEDDLMKRSEAARLRRAQIEMDL